MLLKSFIKKINWIYPLIVLLFISIRLPGLGRDILNSDAERWYRRSENFLHAMQQRNYIETYQRYHPGITLMWFNSLVHYVSFKYQISYTSNPLTLQNVEYFTLIHQISKSFNVLIFCSLLIIHLLFLRKLFNDKIALAYGFIIAFEPYMIAINRWFHQTSFEVFFGFAALLSLLYWYKTNKIRYVLFSAFLLTFSVLAKVTSLILGPVLLVIFIAKYIETKKIDLVPALLFGFSLIVFIFMFFPALWVDPVFIFNKMYNPISEAVTDNIRSDMIQGPLFYLYYSVILIFKLSPILLGLFLISLWNIRKTNDFNLKIFIVSLFNYYIFMTLTDQKIDRYALIFFPFVITICSYYLVTLKPFYIKTFVSLTVMFLVFVACIYYPVYSAYYSPLFGGTKRALSVGVYDNSGEYFLQAAFYLNSKGRNIYTYVPDGLNSFNLLYKGKLQREYDSKTQYVVKSYDMTRLNPIDINCTTLDKSFGSKEHQIVFVWKCF